MGGKIILVASLLSGLPVYILLVYALPKKVIKIIESMFSSFVFGSFRGKPKNKLKSWHNMAKPIDEGGLDFKSID